MQAVPIWRSLWPLRGIWVLLPILMGPAVADAFSDRSRGVQVVGSSLAWGLWALIVVAMFIPRSVTLTVVRLVVPGALALAAWSAVDADRPIWAAVGLAAAAVATLALAAPGVSDEFVNGSSYGTERRVALRIPVPLLAVAVPVSWAVTFAALVAGPMLLAAEQWIAGGVALALGAGAIVVVGRRMHELSRRWLVFVPAGIVVHDPVTLTEPVLFQRHLLARIGLAEAGSDALDVTGKASGLVLEIRPQEPFAVGLREGRGRIEQEAVTALLVTPTQPAVTLSLCVEARLPVA